MTPDAPQREVPGAGSPLSRMVLTGPMRQGRVLASFPTAVYLSVGEHHEVLPLVASDALMLPTAVRVSARGSNLDWGVEPGDMVTLGRSVIRLPGWQVRLVREWRPARVLASPMLPAPRALSEVADLLSAHVRTPELEQQAAAVCRAARSADDDGVRRGTRRLLGAGQGLTPSGDDVLCAVLLVLNGLGDPTPIALLGNAVQDRWTSTTSLSASLLDAARRGYGVPELVTLVETALRGDVTATLEALTSVLDIGHSSGRDLVAGLVGSLRVIAAAPSRVRLPSMAVRPARTLQTVERGNP